MTVLLGNYVNTVAVMSVMYYLYALTNYIINSLFSLCVANVGDKQIRMPQQQKHLP